MKKRLLQLSLPVGLLIFCASHICSRLMGMTDFVKGFFEGMSGTFMLIGLIYLVCSFVRKKIHTENN